MEYYSHTNHKILIGHFPGQTKKIYKDLMYDLADRHFNLPDNIDIISVIKKETIPISPLHKQLTLNNYSYINSIKDRNMLWNKNKKIKYVLDSLYVATKEYCLILDGNDVAILSDLDNIVELFESYNKKVLFNASIWMFPHVIIEHVKDRYKYNPYCFLNAGCCFGKTKDLIDFYEYAYNVYKESLTDVDYEQYYIRKAFDKKQDEVFFDYDCKIFQCWHKCEYIEIDDNKIMLK